MAGQLVLDQFYRPIAYLRDEIKVDLGTYRYKHVGYSRGSVVASPLDLSEPVAIEYIELEKRSDEVFQIYSYTGEIDDWLFNKNIFIPIEEYLPIDQMELKELRALAKEVRPGMVEYFQQRREYERDR